jgi:hypothetical protein
VTGERLARRDKRSWQSAVTLTRINYDRSSYAIEFAIACMGSVSYDTLILCEFPKRKRISRRGALAKEALGPQEDAVFSHRVSADV